ncbi:MAG TPA: hypothetical protein VGP72_09915 [Planctomycetota bacterium]|jgi:hypothetical protein
MYAVGWALLIGVLAILTNVVTVLIGMRGGVGLIMLATWVSMTGSGALRGFALARLWEVKSATRKAVWLGVAAAVVAAAISGGMTVAFAGPTLQRGFDYPDFMAVTYFSSTITGMVLTTLPALAIEKEMQKQRSAAAREALQEAEAFEQGGV